MSNNGWFTMKDVLDDLAKVTGKRMKDFDGTFVLSGEQPPPVGAIEDEDDIRQMHGEFIGGDDGSAGPDLDGIRHMLRMVNDYNGDPAYDDYENINQLEEDANYVVSISKLSSDSVLSTSKIIPNTVLPTNKLNPSTVVPTSKLIPNTVDPTSKSNSNSVIPTTKSNQKNVITMSNLNPNVSEFVPRNMSDSDTAIKKATEGNKGLWYSNERQMKSSGTKEPRCKSVDSKETCGTDNSCQGTDSSGETSETNSCDLGTNYNDIDINKKIDLSNLNSEDIKDIKEKLKPKIILRSKTNCFREKLERNVSNAILLKSHADNFDQPLKLMTPEYFKTAPEKTERVSSKYDNGNVEVRKKTAIEDGESRIQIELNDETAKSANATVGKVNNVQFIPQESNNVWPECGYSPTTFLQKESDVCDYKTQDSTEEEIHVDSVISKEVKESVKKVTNWLYQPQKQITEAPPVFLGPVTFKRKSSASVSPSVVVSESTSSSLTSDSFVPSPYADELARSYMERSKAMVGPPEDMWTRLERQLKEKEKAMKK